jgi:hypothetical protein
VEVVDSKLRLTLQANKVRDEEAMAVAGLKFPAEKGDTSAVQALPRPRPHRQASGNLCVLDDPYFK